MGRLAKSLRYIVDDRCAPQFRENRARGAYGSGIDKKLVFYAIEKYDAGGVAFLRDALGIDVSGRAAVRRALEAVVDQDAPAAAAAAVFFEVFSERADATKFRDEEAALVASADDPRAYPVVRAVADRLVENSRKAAFGVLKEVIRYAVEFENVFVLGAVADAIETMAAGAGAQARPGLKAARYWARNITVFMNELAFAAGGPAGESVVQFLRDRGLITMTLDTVAHFVRENRTAEIRDLVSVFSVDELVDERAAETRFLVARGSLETALFVVKKIPEDDPRAVARFLRALLGGDPSCSYARALIVLRNIHVPDEVRFDDALCGVAAALGDTAFASALADRGFSISLRALLRIFEESCPRDVHNFVSRFLRVRGIPRAWRAPLAAALDRRGLRRVRASLRARYGD